MKKSKMVSYAKYGYFFSIPFVLAFLLFTLYPLVFTVLIGFTDMKGLGSSFSNSHILTDDLLRNFKAILSAPTFQTALKNTVGIWVVNFIPQIGLALLLAAWFTDNRRPMKCQGAFKVIFYMPNIITAATVAILFATLFGYPMGPVNDLLTSFGLSKEPIYFMQNKTIARGVVAFIQFWMWYGYTMIIMISGILGINPEMYEAAEIDGANNFGKFFYITIPNLRTVLIYMLVNSLIGGLQMFDIPNLLVTKSGPDNATLTTSVFIYNQAFSGSYMYNRASAASMIMFVIISILSAVIFVLMTDPYEAAEAKKLKEVEKEMKRKAKEAAKLQKGVK